MTLNAKRDEVPPPDIPDTAVKLKVDHFSNNIRIDEEPLLRSLAKLRSYAKVVSEGHVHNLRVDLEAQIHGLREEMKVAIREASAELTRNMTKDLDKRDEYISTVEESISKVRQEVAGVKENLKKGRLADDSFSESVDYSLIATPDCSPISRMSRGGTPRDTPRDSMPARIGGPPPAVSEEELQQLSPRSRSAEPVSFSPMAGEHEQQQQLQQEQEQEQQPAVEPSSSATVGSTCAPSAGEAALQRSPSRAASRASEALERAASRSPRVSSNIDREASKIERASSRLGKDQVLEEMYAMMQQRGDGTGKLVDNALLEEMQADTAEVQQAIKEMRAKHREDIDKITARLHKADVHRKSEEKKLHSHLESSDKRIGNADASIQQVEKQLGREVNELRDTVLKLQTDTTFADELQRVNDQVDGLQTAVSQAVPSDVVEPRFESLTKNLQQLAERCQKSDKILESAVHDDLPQLYQKYEACTQHLTQVALQADVNQRYDSLSSQCASVGALLKEVEHALGDISAAILQLSSKAEQADLAVVRDELSMFAENMKEKEDAVLFGARCLSCNRVFDDVIQEAGTVDLPVERQRDALFAEVQRALHTPNLDPLAKIKLLAVKVGRPSSVKGGIGVFAGRDGTSFACGTSEVQLMPAVRGCSTATTASSCEDGRISAPPIRPSSTPRPPKRRSHGRTDGWQASRKEGPLDYTHPLSQLVDRGPRVGRALTALA